MEQNHPFGSASVFEQAASYYMISRVIQACAELGLFGQLLGKTLSTESLAKNCHASAHGMRALLQALQALGIVYLGGEKWQLCPGIQGQLPEESLLAGLVGGYRDWLTLAEAVRVGSATAVPAYRRERETVEQFLLGMHLSSLPSAEELAEHLPHPAPQRILDVGGGLGTYAIAICRRFDQARATVLELPQVANIGKRYVARLGLSHRVRFSGCDYLTGPFPGGNDLILMCNILHQEKPSAVRRLFRKAAASLVEGGWLIVHETFLEDDGTCSIAVALAALNSLLYYGGRNYCATEILKWLRACGLEVCGVETTDQPGVRIIEAQRLTA